MTGWELFWFAVASWLIGDGMGKLGRETAKRVKHRRDMRRLAEVSFDVLTEHPRIMVGNTGGMAIGGKPGTEERIAVEVNGDTIFATLTAEIHTIIVPMPDGRVIVLKRTSECIPNGDRLAVVFR
jgi:hypothetical protein